MGPPMSLTRELSFQEKLETILDDMDGDTLQSASENEEDTNGVKDGFAVHRDFADRIEYEEPYIVGSDVRDRDDDHRPRVDESVIEALEQTVKDEKPSVPAEKLDFDSMLGVLLDIEEKYFETLQCETSVFA